MTAKEIIQQGMTEAARRERTKCVAEIREMNRIASGYEWVPESIWSKIVERAAKTLERN